MSFIEKRKRRFNFVDVLLIIIILSISASLIYVFVSPYTNQLINNASTTTIEYRVLVEGVDDQIKYVINEGDKITETNSLLSIGNIVSVEYSDTEYVGVDGEGNSVLGIYPGKKDILLTVRAEASNSKGTYSIGSYTVAAGKMIDFRVPGFISSGNCISIKEAVTNE